MPKKKLTKTQVKKKMATVSRGLYDLFLDKFAYGSSSEVPISDKVLTEFYSKFTRAFNRKYK
jgi:hypothetical protein